MKKELIVYTVRICQIMDLI